jgi:hypothetical protein
MSNGNIPYQVQQIIGDMLNEKDNVHIRGNYRLRLTEINIAIDAAIKKYDTELMLKEGKRPTKRVS